MGLEYCLADWSLFDEGVLSDETRAACDLFRRRDVRTTDEALYSLGAMLPLEMAAHRQIIPGEVAAFATGGRYGLALSDIPYLAEHFGEYGVEHAHEETILSLIAGARLTPDQQARVLRGCIEFLDVLESFYGALDRVIAPPAHP